VYHECQLEQRIKIRENIENEDPKLREDNEPSLDIFTLTLRDMAEQFEDEIGKITKLISLISPHSYFENLQYHSEYIWTQNKTLRLIVDAIV